MDVIQILVFLGIVVWGLFQARAQKQKKPKRIKTVMQTPPAASFSMEKEISEEVIPSPVPETRRKQQYTSVNSSGFEEQDLNVPRAGEQSPEIAFRNVADARRAFIYSEIFHRKYD